MVATVAMVSNEELEPIGRYLQKMGYIVLWKVEPFLARTETVLVWRTAIDQVVTDTVQRFLGSRSEARAILVCDHAAVARSLIDDFRVWIVPSPLASWQLVNYLRDAVQP